jgi:hypothetical protein
LGTDIEVGIPWRAHHSRLESYERTCDWYTTHGFDVIAGEDPEFGERPFNISAARNFLVREHMKSDVMILSDADTLPEKGALLEAIDGAYRDGLVHLPYHLYRDDAGTFTQGATSGIFVFTRSAYEATNGFDPRFEGWGYEDSAWRLAHLTLAGPIPRSRGTVTAASHAPASRSQVSPNAALYGLYQAAYGSPERMAELCKHERLKPETHQDRTARRIARQNSHRPLGARL